MRFYSGRVARMDGTASEVTITADEYRQGQVQAFSVRVFNALDASFVGEATVVEPTDIDANIIDIVGVNYSVSGVTRLVPPSRRK